MCYINSYSKEVLAMDRIELKKADQFTKKEFSQIYAIEAEIFPEGLRESPETMKESISNELGIYLVAKRWGKGIVGYLFCVPHNDAYEGKHYDRLKDFDHRMKEDVSALYIGNVAVLPGFRNQYLFSLLCFRLRSEAKKAGYRRLTMHVRSDLSPLMQRLGARRIYSVSNWFGSGEIVDYLKFSL